MADRFTIIFEKEEEQQRFEKLCRQISKTLADAGITQEMALETLPEARKRVFERLYGRKKQSLKKSGQRI